MTTRTRSAILLLLLGLVGLGAAPASASTAQESCDPATDVVVTIDASALGGEYSSLCVSDADGRPVLDVLAATGIPVETASDGALCRLDGFPAPDQDPCGASPSGDGRWTLFAAEVGGSWAYAQQDPAGITAAAGQFLTAVYAPSAVTPTAPDQVTSAELFASAAFVPSEVANDVVPASDEDDTATGSTPDEDEAPTAWLILGLMVGVLVLVGGTVVVLRRRARNA
ncbi:hypothetical protein [Aeromicrobium sp. Leaf350]|uniref:hypothetical protein n=1 Tax=Aeromicrobium sp. Leaf350 TaxID=2876565 RepID=UPI001E480579|nr:hypothetical protein [Aeromicrobium sp. Leaf350]